MVVQMAVLAGVMDRQFMVRLAETISVRRACLGELFGRSFYFWFGSRYRVPVEQAENVYPFQLYCAYFWAGTKFIVAFPTVEVS